MTHVEQLNIYPLKSARGIPRESVCVAATGFEWDRHWMLIDAAGSFVTQRTHPRLARIETAVARDTLRLSAPGLEAFELPLAPTGEPLTVKVWDDHCGALDQGHAAAAWLSAALEVAVRLVRVPGAIERRANPKFAGAEPALVAFQDGFPLLVTNRASLEDLNGRMPQPVPMERFRPSIVLEGLPAFAEDRIESLQIGAVNLRLVKPCTRCVITATDQRTGERSTNPLPILRQFRFDRSLLGVTFGENAVIAAGVGARIERGAECIVSFESAGPGSG